MNGFKERGHAGRRAGKRKMKMEEGNEKENGEAGKIAKWEGEGQEEAKEKKRKQWTKERSSRSRDDNGMRA